MNKKQGNLELKCKDAEYLGFVSLGSGLYGCKSKEHCLNQLYFGLGKYCKLMMKIYEDNTKKRKE